MLHIALLNRFFFRGLKAKCSLVPDANAILSRCNLFPIVAFLLLIGLASDLCAQQPTPQEILKKSLIALSGPEGLAQAATLEGQVSYVAGSQKEQGRVRFIATSGGKIRSEVRIPSGDRVEVTRPKTHDGEIRDKKGKIEKLAAHNTLRSRSWFFPEFYLSDAIGENRTAILGESTPIDGRETTRIVTFLASKSPNHAALLRRITASYIYIEKATLLPLELDLNEHPNESAGVTIPVKIIYADYRSVGGHTIPFHITRYVNGTLNMDITLSRVDIQSSTSDSDFLLK